MKKICLFVICIILSVLAGCSNDSVNQPEYKTEARTVKMDEPIGNIKIIYGSKMLCSKINKTVVDYMIYDFETGKSEKIATVTDFALQGRNRILIGDTAYFYVRLYDGKNALYAVNFSKNRMYQVMENTYSLSFAPMICFEDEMYVLQGDNDNGGVERFIERISPKGKAKRIEFQHSGNNEARTIFFIDSDNEFIYTYEESSVAAYLVRYDSNFSYDSELDITNVIKEHPLSGGMGSLRVFGNYFVITDVSGASMLCRYDENGAEVILFDWEMEHAVNSGESEHEFFYIRRTNDVYRLTPKIGDFEKITFELDNENSVIRYMRIYNENLFISKIPAENGDKSETWYYFPYEN